MLASRRSTRTCSGHVQPEHQTKFRSLAKRSARLAPFQCNALQVRRLLTVRCTIVYGLVLLRLPVVYPRHVLSWCVQDDRSQDVALRRSILAMMCLGPIVSAPNPAGAVSLTGVSCPGLFMPSWWHNWHGHGYMDMPRTCHRDRAR